MIYTQESFAQEQDVSRDTLADFERWQALLRKWNSRINLVSTAAIEGFWARHALDSWQLAAHIPKDTSSILDLGSGAGFPGIALAIGAKSRGQGHVTLVESAGKKANFLRAVIRELDLPAEVWAGRAEDLTAQPYNIISARAFAPLPRLLTYAQPFWGASTAGLFLKGQGVIRELTEAQKYWTFDVEKIASRTDSEGVILKIDGLIARS